MSGDGETIIGKPQPSVASSTRENAANKAPDESEFTLRKRDLLQSAHRVSSLKRVRTASPPPEAGQEIQDETSPSLRASDVWQYIRHEFETESYAFVDSGAHTLRSVGSPFSLSSSTEATMKEVDEFMQRQKEVYDFLQVPLELEQLLWFGFLICVDSFLFVFTFLPIRVCIALLKLLTRFFTSQRLSTIQLYDLMRGVICIVCVFILWNIETSFVYHYIRGQAALKLYVIYNVLEIFDKLCCSFGQDIFDTLFWNTAYDAVADTAGSGPATPKRLRPFTHFFVALVYVVIHSFVLLYQVVTLNVAVNSHNSALLTLLVSNQFVELKGHVFKRFEKQNLFQISCSDMVERFQIVVFLVIVLLHNFYDLNWDFSEQWLAQMAGAVTMVLSSELLVDWIKHAFITKFNRLNPEVYRNFLSILAADVITAIRQKSLVDSSHAVSRRIGFVPLPLGCLVMRFLGLVVPVGGWALVGVVAVACIVLAVVKLLIRRILLRLSSKKIIHRTPRAKSEEDLQRIQRFTMTNKGEESVQM